MKHLIVFLSASASALLMTCAHATDISSAFNGYTNGCVIKAESGAQVLTWLTPSDAKGSLGKKPALPADLANALGNPSKKDQGDHWLFSVPVQNATFKNLKVKSIDRWIGKDNGVNGFAIGFEEAPANVKAAFKNEKFKADEEGHKPSLQSNKKTGKLDLVCDSSM